jgi:AraC-like DNA-binding protein
MSVALRSSVTTESVPVQDRLAYWEHYNATALVGLNCTTYEERGLAATQVNLDLDGCRVAAIAGNPHVIERTPRLVASHPKGATFLTLLTRGEAFLYHRDGLLRMGPGDVVVYDTGKPYLFGFTSTMRQLLIDVPNDRLRAEADLDPPDVPLLVRGGQPGPLPATVRTLHHTLERIVTRPSAAGDELTAVVRRSVRTLLAGPGRGGPESALLAAKAFIEEHLDDPSLDVELVARATGFSSRHLGRIFAPEGTSVSRYVHHRRLLRARADLTDPALADERISDIAHRWGFASQAHFATAFKRAFECTPSEYRARD